MKALKFRAWTGKQMVYQEDQYLGSFIRRAVAQIIQDNSEELTAQDHESYLPNGGDIEEYLTQVTGTLDFNEKEIYHEDIVRAIAEEEYKEDTGTYVVIRGDSGQWQLIAIKDYQLFSSGLPLEWGGWATLKVTGNVNENPELLEAKK